MLNGKCSCESRGDRNVKKKKRKTFWFLLKTRILVHFSRKYFFMSHYGIIAVL